MRRRSCLAGVRPAHGAAGARGGRRAGPGGRGWGRHSHDEPPRAVLPTLSSATFLLANEGPGSARSRVGSGSRWAVPLRPPGRIVFFHGVDAVYPSPPYELYPDPKKPWNFSSADASLMARLGFNVVRLGMTWSGLGPGTAAGQRPGHLRPGDPTNPNQFNQAAFNRYVATSTTVDLLGRFHIYTILDMHQDVYNEMFEGEGEPDWAVCTNDMPSIDPPGRWSLEYSTRRRASPSAISGATTSGATCRASTTGCGGSSPRLSGQPWVLGYDPFNEPFSTSLIRFGDAHFDAELECFYTGTAHVGTPSHGAPATAVPDARPGGRRRADASWPTTPPT